MENANSIRSDPEDALIPNADETTSLLPRSAASSSNTGSNRTDPVSSSYGTSSAGEDGSPETVHEESEAAANDGTPQNNEGNAADDDSANDGEETRDGAIGTLTRRLRCLFSTITWPIVPLGTIVALALLWVLYAASSLDWRRSCSHPLHWYALASLILVAYIPHHAQVRSCLFQYSRERDGPIRPARVRMYDQFFHTVCLLYVYTGVTLIQTCKEDILTTNSETETDAISEDQQLKMMGDEPLNTCEATCPNLYQAMSVYVGTLELFTFALILPLLFLPCIYLWFLRRATAEAEAFAQLQDRLQEEETLLSNGGVTANEILDSLENVKLVSRSSQNGERQVWLLPSSATDASIGMNSDVKECCICMSDFPVQNEADLEDGLFEENPADLEDGLFEENPNPAKDSASTSSSEDASGPVERGVVRTRCGHVFHKECLSGWVGGRWQLNPQANNSAEDEAAPDNRRRRARQTCCPLCREDLRPSSN
jgi:hypothetical protein